MATDPLVYFCDDSGKIGTIDLTTGATTVIGNAGVQLTSLAFNPTGQLYGATATSLYSVNLASGAVTKIGDFGGTESISGIRFSGGGTLYADASVFQQFPNPAEPGKYLTSGETNANLYVVNQQTGAASLVGFRDDGYQASLGTLTFYNGSLYETEFSGHYGSYSSVNPSNGVGIKGFSNGFLTLGTTFSGPNNTFYGFYGNAIDAINVQDGSASQALTFNNTGLGLVVAAAFPTEATPQGSFFIQDGTTGQYSYTNGSTYTGPASGPTSEFVTNTSDILNVTAMVPSAFIEVGYVPGQQTPPSEGGINVSYANGDNVLDGYAGSNFLTGGTGKDTFYIDDRTLTQNSWSTVVNFHAGDGVTMWGVTPQDFTTTVLDGQGAAGYTGVTIVFSAAGKPAAAVTLAGYKSADLINGRLDVSYGTTPDTGGIPGATYMHIAGG